MSVDLFGEGPCCEFCHVYIPAKYLDAIPAPREAEADIIYEIRAKTAKYVYIYILFLLWNGCCLCGRHGSSVFVVSFIHFFSPSLHTYSHTSLLFQQLSSRMPGYSHQGVERHDCVCPRVPSFLHPLSRAEVCRFVLICFLSLSLSSLSLLSLFDFFSLLPSLWLSPAVQGHVVQFIMKISIHP